MTEQEVKIIEQSITRLKSTVTELTQQKTELELRISTLENVQTALTRLLPTDKRIDHLFS